MHVFVSEGAVARPPAAIAISSSFVNSSGRRCSAFCRGKRRRRIILGKAKWRGSGRPGYNQAGPSLVATWRTPLSPVTDAYRPAQTITIYNGAFHDRSCRLRVSAMYVALLARACGVQEPDGRQLRWLLRAPRAWDDGAGRSHEHRKPETVGAVSNQPGPMVSPASMDAEGA